MATIKWYNPDTDEWEYVGVGSSGGGSGDVVGPSSATNNGIAIYDGTTGKTIKNSYLSYNESTNTLSSSRLGYGALKIEQNSTASPVEIGGKLRVGTDGDNDTAEVNTDATWRPIASTSGAQTFTNKRINPRVTSTTSASSLTPDILSADQYNYTALAANLTINAPTGTHVDGNKLLFRIKDNGTSRTLTWNSVFRAIGVTLPTATTVSKTHYIGCVYNAADTKWDVIAAVIEA